MILKFINRFVARGFFIGNIPGAPGTWGSILAVILLLFLPSLLSNIWIIIPLFFLGVYTSHWEEIYTGIHDHGKIIIDEIVGLFIVFIGIPHQPWLLITGFFLFRFFDILKPLGIAKTQQLPGGWGIMADDILAGILSNLILQIIVFIIY